MVDAFPGEAIVHIVDNKFIQVIPPRPDDAPDVAAIKLFILAAIGRRQNDPDWDTELFNWFANGGGDMIAKENLTDKTTVN